MSKTKQFGVAFKAFPRMGVNVCSQPMINIDSPWSKWLWPLLRLRVQKGDWPGWLRWVLGRGQHRRRAETGDQGKRVLEKAVEVLERALVEIGTSADTGGGIVEGGHGVRLSLEAGEEAGLVLGRVRTVVPKDAMVQALVRHWLVVATG